MDYGKYHISYLSATPISLIFLSSFLIFFMLQYYQKMGLRPGILMIILFISSFEKDQENIEMFKCP